MDHPDVDPEATLALTGERTAPGIASENYWLQRHVVVYEFVAAGLATDQVLIEVGCGEGYGSAALAAVTGPVAALDYDRPAVVHARRRYRGPHFVQGNLAALPFGNQRADVVVALQVIEHVWDHPQFVDECRRVLRPDGRLVLSTPNRLTFSPGTDEPTNPFHTHEFTGAELTGLLAARGLGCRLYSVTAGPRLRRLDDRHDGLVRAQLATPPEQWSRRLTVDVASVRAADFAVVGDDVADVDDGLDLVAVAWPEGGVAPLPPFPPFPPVPQGGQAQADPDGERDDREHE
jgi:SAM-dependent methyltransferase